jgi:hypothetical protein
VFFDSFDQNAHMIERSTFKRKRIATRIRRLRRDAAA